MHESRLHTSHPAMATPPMSSQLVAAACVWHWQADGGCCVAVHRGIPSQTRRADVAEAPDARRTWRVADVLRMLKMPSATTQPELSAVLLRKLRGSECKVHHRCG